MERNSVDNPLKKLLFQLELCYNELETPSNNAFFINLVHATPFSMEKCAWQYSTHTLERTE